MQIHLKIGLLILSTTVFLLSCEDHCPTFFEEIGADRLATDSGTTTSLQIDTLSSTLNDPIGGPGGEGELRCTEATLKAFQVRDLTEDQMPASGDMESIVYPGAILQGASFERGDFVPVTIPTKGGKLTLTGISGTGSTSVEATSFDRFSEVKSAIDQLLIQVDEGAKSTTANFRLTAEKANSLEELRFNFGLDARFPMGAVEAAFNFSKKEEISRVVLKFDQVFYSINIDTPQEPCSLFRDDKDFKDPDGQIASGNPALYVKSVQYGRQIYFVVESKHSTKNIEASLRAAYGNQAAGTAIEGELGLTVGEVLNESSITYIVNVGDADRALENPPTYDAVLDLIAEGAEWSLENPGTPLAYELRYLSDNAPVKMEFSSEFQSQNCELVRPEGAVYRVTLEYIECIDCKELNAFDDNTREFGGKLRVSTSKASSSTDIDLSINGVPEEGRVNYPSGKNKDFIIVDPSESDWIKLEVVNLKEFDTGNGDDIFASESFKADFGKLPNLLITGKGTAYNFEPEVDKSGANYQKVRIRATIIKIE
ncbi:MAG: thiol-activated cytolysin family protein [Bacteroidota bacterium]